MRKDRSLRWAPEITAEKVEAARRELGLDETATREELIARYRDLARRWHPDVCGEADPLACRERFRRIANAKALLVRFMQRYRYSFSPEDIRRDQEDAEVRRLRQYGGGIYFDPAEAERKIAEFNRRHPDRITAENVSAAAGLLGLGKSAAWWEIEHAYRRLAAESHPDRFPPDERDAAKERFQEIERAFSLLRKYVENYRYSFRPDDVRNRQEDLLEHHRRQFANDPIWAGGEFDDPWEH